MNCIGNDPLCPCQDGDLCHYRGPNAWRPAKWLPKDGKTSLDGLQPNQHILFRFILTRNGHNVSLYGGQAACERDLADRKHRFPADDWGIVDRGSDYPRIASME